MVNPDKTYLNTIKLNVFIFVILVFISGTYSQTEVGKWRRIVIPFTNTTYSDNPFEIEIDGVFTHTSSGTIIKLPGYYDGNDTWEIGFMPTKTGTWTYTTESQDPDLDRISGSIECVESGNAGMLRNSNANPRKWKYTDGDYVIPITLRMEFFSEPGSISQFTGIADFLKNNNIQMMETRLLEEYGQFEGRYDFIFEGSWQNHRFDLDIWNRMEQRMEVLTEKDLGGHIMFYSDGNGAPGWEGQSETEELVIRYTVARLAGYPVVWFNTGIDIAEYRSQQDINWFGEKVKELDPYDHPVSSRYGGGSGNYIIPGQTFDSHGDRTALINDMISYYNNTSVPVSMDDAWGENRPSHPEKNFTPDDIRRAFWKCVITGGLGGLIRSDGGGCGYNGFFHFSCLEQDLESEQWLKLINPFIKNKLGVTFADMEPANSLITNAYCLADPLRTIMLFYTIGEIDKWDTGEGGSFTINMTSLSSDYNAIWFNPRTGTETSLGVLQGNLNHQITPPDSDDWVLLLTSTTLPVRIEDINGQVLNFSLEQNYPNPFNPVTMISFSIPETLKVSLIVYDSLGKEVAVLLNKEMLPGKYYIEFDGSRLNSGVYFVQLSTEKYSSVKKMLLLK